MKSSGLCGATSSATKAAGGRAAGAEHWCRPACVKAGKLRPRHAAGPGEGDRRDLAGAEEPRVRRRPQRWCRIELRDMLLEDPVSELDRDGETESDSERGACAATLAGPEVIKAGAF